MPLFFWIAKGYEKAGYTLDQDYIDADIDTDGDTITDGFELLARMNPLSSDTDHDGLSDGDEYELGTNPNNPDTDNDGIIDSDEIYEQSISKEINVSEKPEVTSVSVSFGANENIKRTTTIRSLYGIDLRASSVVGLVGSPMSIETSSEFEQATITFNYNEDELGDTDEDDLEILWYNEEDGEFVLLDPYLDTTHNRVSVDTNHFSTYMVVDKAKWHELWSRELDYSRNTSTPGIPTQYYDIVFAIDSSGSMSGNDTSGLRREAAKQFVDAFYSEDQGAVVDFTVGLGYGVNSSLLDSIATSTGGQFYQAAESDELRDIFFGIEDETIGDGEIDTTDTDGDGLYDTYEIVGMKTPYGIVYSDPLLKDSDGDGLDDGEEMGSFSVTVSGGEIAYKGFYPLSLADRIDSDGDGIEDSTDKKPMIFDDIPDVLVAYLSEELIDYDDVVTTKDGFTLCKKPLSEIFEELDIESITGERKYTSDDFDDWYIYAVKEENDVVYSILKMRELENSSPSSTAIPFISLNIDLIEQYANDLDDTEVEVELATNLQTVTEGIGYEYSQLLCDYFRR